MPARHQFPFLDQRPKCQHMPLLATLFLLLKMLSLQQKLSGLMAEVVLLLLVGG